MRVKELTMAQPNESDLSTTFSTLNVNAMEFVPSFCSSQPSPSPAATETTTEQSSPTTDVATDDIPNTVPEATGTISEEITTTTATTTEPIEDKTPENPGERK